MHALYTVWSIRWLNLFQIRPVPLRVVTKITHWQHTCRRMYSCSCIFKHKPILFQFIGIVQIGSCLGEFHRQSTIYHRGPYNRGSYCVHIIEYPGSLVFCLMFWSPGIFAFEVHWWYSRYLRSLSPFCSPSYRTCYLLPFLGVPYPYSTTTISSIAYYLP